ncbi:MAG: hypothetical protein QM718_04875 [Steroidobacteraceae bacterium]
MISDRQQARDALRAQFPDAPDAHQAVYTCTTMHEDAAIFINVMLAHWHPTAVIWRLALAREAAGLEPYGNA